LMRRILLNFNNFSFLLGLQWLCWTTSICAKASLSV
jgi:hypothetical protein